MDDRTKLRAMHRRAQKAEGLLRRLQAEHAAAVHLYDFHRKRGNECVAYTAIMKKSPLWARVQRWLDRH